MTQHQRPAQAEASGVAGGADVGSGGAFRIRHWYVAETKVMAETKAIESLRKRGIRVYEPKLKKSIRHHRTKQLIIRRFRLFNRYLFISIPEPVDLHIGPAKNCDGVSDILGLSLNGKACEINREIVALFMRAQRRGQFNEIIPQSRRELRDKLPLGAKIRISNRQSPFSGFYGFVTDIKGRGVIKAGLSIFGRLVPVELQSGDFTVLKEDVAA